MQISNNTFNINKNKLTDQTKRTKHKVHYYAKQIIVMKTKVIVSKLQVPGRFLDNRNLYPVT